MHCTGNHRGLSQAASDVSREAAFSAGREDRFAVWIQSVIAAITNIAVSAKLELRLYECYLWLMLTRKQLESLQTEGFVLIREFECVQDTLTCARSIGQVVDIATLAPAYRVQEVQKLQPRARASSCAEKYYGNFGLDEYPAHTDLAHWNVPPRYFLLRACTGSPFVQTHVYRSSDLRELLPKKLIDCALFVPRKTNHAVVPLQMAVMRTAEFSIRWDSLFIHPLNNCAKACAEILTSDEFINRRINISLIRKGDTLIIDNWTTLHGRGQVPASEASRMIDRVYFRRLHGLPS